VTIEDEEHFILECTINSKLRTDLFAILANENPNIMQFSSEQKLIFKFIFLILQLPNNYVKVKTVQTCLWGNENVFHETYITVSISLLKTLHLFQHDTLFSIQEGKQVMFTLWSFYTLLYFGEFCFIF
jgi:hypothetical protein